jgi:hypothetical protein
MASISDHYNSRRSIICLEMEESHLLYPPFLITKNAEAQYKLCCFLLQCHICGKSFSLKHNLQEHHFIHTGEKPFQVQDLYNLYNKYNKSCCGLATFRFRSVSDATFYFDADPNLT